MFYRALLGAAAVVLFSQAVRATQINTDAGPAALPANAPAGFVWTRPTSNAAATSSHTTYQLWGTSSAGFTAPPGPNAANALINPNSTALNPANVFDNAYSTSGAFMAGQDIYSFSGVIQPQVDVPGYNIAGNHLNVILQVQAFGTIDTTDLTVNGVKASTLPNYSVTQTWQSTPIDTGFGLSSMTDYAWTFTTPDATTTAMQFGWDEVSVALQSVSVDTQSTATPEPASLGLLSLAGVWLLRRRRIGV